MCFGHPPCLCTSLSHSQVHTNLGTATTFAPRAPRDSTRTPGAPRDLHLARPVRRGGLRLQTARRLALIAHGERSPLRVAPRVAPGVWLGRTGRVARRAAPRVRLESTPKLAGMLVAIVRRGNMVEMSVQAAASTAPPAKIRLTLARLGATIVWPASSRPPRVGQIAVRAPPASIRLPRVPWPARPAPLASTSPAPARPGAPCALWARSAQRGGAQLAPRARQASSKM